MCHGDINQIIIFNDWNFHKKSIDKKPDLAIYPKIGEVWYMALGKNIGREQNGVGKDFERPILVIKKWNNEMIWGIPLSTKQKTVDFYYNFTDPFGREISAIIAQLRLISTKRCKRKLYTLDKFHFDVICSEIKKNI